MDIPTNIISIITDKSQSLLRRFKYVILIIMIIFLANEYSNFLFNYNINQKIDQLKNIYEIYPDSLKCRSEIIDEFQKIETEIINKKNIIERAKISALNKYNNLSSSSFSVNWWYLFTFVLKYHFLFAIMALIFPFIADKGHKNIQVFLYAYLVLFILSMITYYLTIAIFPRFDSEIINFIFSIISQITVLSLFVWISNKIEDK